MENKIAASVNLSDEIERIRIDAKQEGKQEARKEVADFVNTNIPQTLAKYIGFWHLWQAFLKEKGIEAESGE